MLQNRQIWWSTLAGVTFVKTLYISRLKESGLIINRKLNISTVCRSNLTMNMTKRSSYVSFVMAVYKYGLFTFECNVASSVHAAYLVLV